MPKSIRLPITREWVMRREAILVAQEDAAIRAARDSATTPEDRAFVDAVIALRAQRCSRDSGQ